MRIGDVSNQQGEHRRAARLKGRRHPVVPVAQSHRDALHVVACRRADPVRVVLTYILTVMQRTSLGVAGLDAARRFGITPGVLAAFVFIQVTVYIAAQTPAGLLIDRFGPRVMLVVSGVFLTTGQLVLASATALPQAVLARILVGLGDAIVFVAVLGLVPRWFAARRVPLITQLTTILGQFGQILSAVPFLVLHGYVLAIHGLHQLSQAG